jgi:hypothetical protein
VPVSTAGSQTRLLRQKYNENWMCTANRKVRRAGKSYPLIHSISQRKRKKVAKKEKETKPYYYCFLQ